MDELAYIVYTVIRADRMEDLTAWELSVYYTITMAERAFDEILERLKALRDEKKLKVDVRVLLNKVEYMDELEALEAMAAKLEDIPEDELDTDIGKETFKCISENASGLGNNLKYRDVYFD